LKTNHLATLISAEFQSSQKRKTRVKGKTRSCIGFVIERKLQTARIEEQISKVETVVGKQGDQIGPIFAQSAIV
jgi:hypothetical protein